MIFGVPTGQKCHFCTKGTFWCGDSENSQEPKIWPTWWPYDVIFQNGGNSSLRSTHFTSSANWSHMRGIKLTKIMFRHQPLHIVIYRTPFGHCPMLRNVRIPNNFLQASQCFCFRGTCCALLELWS